MKLTYSLFLEYEWNTFPLRQIKLLKLPTRCNSFSVYYPEVCLQLNMFRAFSRPSSGAQWLQWQPLVLLSYRGDSRAVGRGRAGRHDHDQQHCYHHAPTVKPEAATAVVVAPDDGHEDARNMLSRLSTFAPCMLLYLFYSNQLMHSFFKTHLHLKR